ncbi:IS66 family insertion sequence element accessory protein TnpB [Rhodospirillum sp. A1_3_36]|uniref:IS66 family insertion sequence element accessory protein TnpB n=1 Tax=Rhodospirillum sp. A1_3_36 TaxID=3391666 RepID=UPI0039A640A4
MGKDPFAGHLFVFRRRRGDLIKVLAWEGQGFCLFNKRLERGRFVWPRAEGGVISPMSAQLSMLLEGIDWRMPQRTWRPEDAFPPEASRATKARTCALMCRFPVGLIPSGVG